MQTTFDPFTPSAGASKLRYVGGHTIKVLSLASARELNNLVLREQYDQGGSLVRACVPAIVHTEGVGDDVQMCQATSHAHSFTWISSDAPSAHTRVSRGSPQSTPDFHADLLALGL